MEVPVDMPRLTFVFGVLVQQAIVLNGDAAATVPVEDMVTAVRIDTCRRPRAHCDAGDGTVGAPVSCRPLTSYSRVPNLLRLDSSSRGDHRR